jgi:hypothetical protein
LNAVPRSFLGRLASGLVDELLAEDDRPDYPASSTIYEHGEGAALKE